MPSVSGPQHRLMEAVAHDPGFAAKVGIPQKVGRDFAAADKGRSFKGAVRAVARHQLAKKRAAQFKRAA